MSWETCKTCRKLDWSSSHRCAPAWKLWRPEEAETEEDAVIVYALSAESAVEEWAECHDRDGDYDILEGCEATVHIRYDGDPERAKWMCLPTEELIYEVTGERVPSYSAYLQKPKRAPSELPGLGEEKDNG